MCPKRLSDLSKMSMPKPFELVPSMVDSAGSVDSGNMCAKSNGCRIVCFVALGTPKTGSKNRPIFVHKCGFGPFWVLERASTRFAVRMTKVSCKSFFRTNRCIFVSGGEVRKISVFGRVVLGESFCAFPGSLFLLIPGCSGDSCPEWGRILPSTKNVQRPNHFLSSELIRVVQPPNSPDRMSRNRKQSFRQKISDVPKSRVFCTLPGCSTLDPPLV